MSKRPIVAFLVNDFTVGGAQRLHIDLFNNLHDQFEMHLITLMEFPNRTLMYDEVPPEVTVHRLNFASFRDFTSWRKLLRLLRSIRPDVVVSSLFLSNTIARVLKPLVGYTSIIVIHNTYIAKTQAQIVVDWILSHVTYRIVAVSNSVRTFTAAQEHIPLEKFVVIPNGLNLRETEPTGVDCAAVRAELGLSPDDHLVIDVARLTDQKNLQLLIDAFADFSKEYPTYTLAIFGEGVLRKQLEDRIKDRDAHGRILLAGVRKDLVPYYKAADFFVSSSFIEGFGLAHAEALLCGTPVLTTKTAGPDEMIKEGENGFFIEGTSKENILAGLRKMKATNLSSMQAAAMRSVEGLDIKRTAEAYTRLIHESIGL